MNILQEKLLIILVYLLDVAEQDGCHDGNDHRLAKILVLFASQTGPAVVSSIRSFPRCISLLQDLHLSNK